LKLDVIKETKRETEIIPETPIKPPPGQAIWVKWKNITIGKLIGRINFIGKEQIVVATDRPSLAVIRELALTGHSSLR